MVEKLFFGLDDLDAELSELSYKLSVLALVCHNDVNVGERCHAREGGAGELCRVCHHNDLVAELDHSAHDARLVRVVECQTVRG